MSQDTNKGAARAELAENIAAVTAELVAIITEDSTLEENESRWPGQYRYQLFGGFPGWWSFCAGAGLAFHDVHSVCDEPDGWADAVIAYGDLVWRDITINHDYKSYPGPVELEAMAREAIAAAVAK